jgi:DNA-binding transcriptional MocR family regulator
MSTGSPYSQRVRNLHPSPIREILAVIDRPGMVSFAGGLPAPETFASIDAAAMPPHWLQYGPSEGEPALRMRIAEELARIGLACAPEQVLVLSGSQQGIDLVGKLFVDEGTTVAVETPTYLAALQVFRFFGARFVAMARGARTLATGTRPAFAYAIPTFQNPTGACYGAAERDALAQACDAAGVPLFEDDPYRDLVYDACDRTPVCARLRRASWVYQGSFSKSFAPGLRLGFLAASPDLVPYLVRLKQAADLHSNRLSQWLVLEALDDPARGERLAALAQTYRVKRDAFARLLQRHLGGLARWETPAGGLFFWLTHDAMLDTRALLAPAIERGVAFMPGEPFYADGRRAAGALRLNFSHVSEAQADAGLAILAELLRETAAAQPPRVSPTRERHVESALR